jgi:hypothetical protein
MLLQLTLLLTALAVNTLVVLPNKISTLSGNQLLQKRTRIDNTENVRMPRTDEALGVNTKKYTTQQMEQYYQAHLDVLKMCWWQRVITIRTSSKDSLQCNSTRKISRRLSVSLHSTVSTRWSASDG